VGKRTYQSTKALRVSVEDDGLDRILARLEQQGIDAAHDELVAFIEKQVQFAYSQWGVDTGQGRESLMYVKRRRPDGTFAVRVFSRHQPVKYQSWTGKRPTFWQVLIQNPIRKATRKLARTIAKAIAKGATHGR